MDVTGNTTTSRQHRIGFWMAMAVALAFAPAYAAAAPATSQATVSGATRFVAVAPMRLADTRPGAQQVDFTRISANVIRIGVAQRSGVPQGATAAILTVTMVNPIGGGFASVFPAGSAVPTTSTVNAVTAGQIVANQAHVKLGESGSVDVFMNTPMDIVVDLFGVFVPTSGPVTAGRLVTLDSPKRALDTRSSQGPLQPRGTTTIDTSTVGVPQGASAVVVNITAVRAAVGFWTAYAAGTERPVTSNLNIDEVNQTRAVMAIVALVGGSPSFTVFSQSGGDLVVDVMGWFTGESADASDVGLFVPADPQRLLDTRQARALAPWAGSTYEVAVGGTPGQVQAVAANITATDPWDSGFVTTFAAGTQLPNTSTLNLDKAPQTIANQAIVRISPRGLAVYTSTGTHLIVDLAGWYTGAPTAATLATPVNPTYAPSTPQRLQIPRIGLDSAIGLGNSLTPILDTGIVATWKVGGTLGRPYNLQLLGHRNTYGGVFYNLGALVPGDTLVIVGSDGHSYLYRVTRIDVTTPDLSAVQDPAFNTGLATLHLVTCSSSNGSPNGASHRLVVSARLVHIR
ncbi:MAG: sortase [Actinomycetota bacterium]|nr:sortase [Actinomycetota bacterium]